MCCIFIKSHFVIIVTKVIVICFLSIIPWPGPSVFKISCSRDSSRVVRKIVQSKWLPILEKYQVQLPLECPFHPLRDIFGPQQSAKKQHRPSQWTCGFCGKSFFEEKHLDMHFESRHRSNINMAEDAVCLADYCDMMRCEVLIAKDATLSFGGDPNMMSTDIEVWSESTAYRTALSTSGPRDLAKVPVRKSFFPKILQTLKNDILNGHKTQTSSLEENQLANCDASEHRKRRANKHSPDEDVLDQLVNVDDDGDDEDEEDEEDEDDDENDNDNNATSQCDQNLVDSSLPPVDRKQQNLSAMQRMKANCKSEELDQLKTRCEILVRDCIVGLLVQLSLEDFKSMEEELNRAVCWYLSCERYWEDGPLDQRPFPWGLVFVLVMVLSLGVCLCYYIIWILFDEDHSPIGSNQITAHPSPTHGRHYLQPQSASIYHLQDGGHSATSLNSLGQMSNINVATTGASSGTDLQHTPQIHAAQVQYGDEGGYGYTAEGTNATVADGAAILSGTAGGTEFSELGQSEHYIYVTYPPELKRRLLESCYNRTTRL
ncbi:uncharacterized protein LOC129773412 isoform X2 [Toxorhynchites rutilus septentrionalis]|uniref:uncharacterized protein LOC129773412 isoform X2 n=1 Tax=Toxorhynchites rutilus septentrionalis TaxID=329112 RepID=UPI00247AF74A|nr:uncharacterized protein LOC129773412 isoform X2 [Toxorhynchites rutilus septentrionalis]